MTKYQRLLERRSIPGKVIAFNERFNSLQENEDIKYLLASMEPMDADYTQTSLSEAERVHKYLAPYSTIRLQGSIQTNTHIRYHSDIDILTITPDFETYEGAIPSSSTTYQSDPITTLKALRTKSRTTISGNFPKVSIEDKSRALALSGGSLERKVDVVAANWYNTLAYGRSYEEKDRGIHILDVSTSSRIMNKPFLHQHLLNHKNAATGNGLCRAIRMLKTLKMDADAKIEISSYDICSLVWNMEPNLLPGGENHAFQLAQNVATQLVNWVNNLPRLNALMVPNETRRIIDAEGTTLEAIRSLWYELHKLLEKIAALGKKLDRQFVTVGQSLYQF